MKTVFKFLGFLIIAFLLSCSGNSGKESQSDNSKKNKAEENPYPEIKSEVDFHTQLKDMGISIAEGTVFIEFKSEIPQGSQDKFPSVFRCIYKVRGENYKANEDSLLNHYTRMYNDKLKSKGWTNNSRPGTGILDFHQFAGKIKTVSIRVTTSDEALKAGKQELSIELWAR